MDNNRTIFAVVLIVLLWSGYSLFFNQPVPVDNQTPEINKTVVKKEISENQPVKKESTSSADKVDYNFNNSVEFEPITVKSDLYSMTLSRQGATIKDIYLNKYKNIVDENETIFHFFNSDKSIHTLITSGSDGFNLPEDLVYSLKNINNNVLELDNSSKSLVFIANLDNYKIEKKYTFYSDRYDFDLEINIISNSEKNITGRLNLILNTPWTDDHKSDRYSYTGPLTYNGEKLLKDKVKDVKESSVSYSNIVWSGFTTKYFISVINPGVSMEREIISFNNNNIYNKFISRFFNIDNGESVNFKYSSYFGPKKKEYLSKSGNQYEEAIHYGFFHFLSQPLMTVLKFFYKYIGNYGFSIILLTVCIKILFWPLTQKSYSSMKGMQKLQPEMKKLREKFGDDKQRLNQEMMKFYKEHKVNPLGGCLPMVIQIPVFIALYRVLLEAIELRHAPFMLWLTDLSAKDPYYITPLVMGATMFLQQKMTPTNMDPTQEKLMLMMPIVFTFIFLNFPSGLVIYWLTNNILTIFQQYLIRRQPD